MAKKQWGYNPRKKQSTSKVPDRVKQEVEQKAKEIVDSTLKPQYVKPPPEEPQFNYLVDIYTKWYRHYFYFCSTYNVPGPNAISPSFEDKFARLEYVGADQFNLSYMRHTEQWFEIASGISLEQALTMIKQGDGFRP